MTDRPGTRGRISGRLLYRLLVAATVFGILLQGSTLVLKPAANDFRVWTNFRDAEPARAAFFAEHPQLDLARAAPFLTRIAWHAPHETPFLRVYARHAAFDAVVLVLLLVFRRRTVRALERFATWLREPRERRARRLVLAFSGVIVSCYLSLTSLGFFFPGIGGWTYSDWRGRLRAELDSAGDPDPAGGRVPSAEERAFLERAVAFENARFLPRAGYLSGPGMFLHYSDGSVLPASYELTEMVFPRYYFGGKNERVNDPDTFGRVLRSSLSNWRRYGGRFLLPASLAYPNHAVYAPIDYSEYPDPATLERVTFWHLTLSVDAERRAELVTALQHLSVDV